jgi:hypothetical protein
MPTNVDTTPLPVWRTFDVRIDNISMVLLRSGKTFDVTIILPRLAEAVIICNKVSED